MRKVCVAVVVVLLRQGCGREPSCARAACGYAGRERSAMRFLGFVVQGSGGESQ